MHRVWELKNCAAERTFGTSVFPKTRSQLRCFDLGLAGGARSSSQYSNFFCLSTWRRRAHFLRQIALHWCGWSSSLLSLSDVLQPSLASSQELLKVWSNPRDSPYHFSTPAVGANPQHMGAVWMTLGAGFGGNAASDWPVIAANRICTPNVHKMVNLTTLHAR